ncbi:hypothetical protein [Paenibacillus apiarius]|uniref:hypothetical protein n=1 Tax=Paenibacillus apiarius TaxID=46240 RepID=UPI003B3A8718
MNKPTIPNEVADAIEFFRVPPVDDAHSYSNAEIIEVALSGEEGSHEGALTSFDFDTLMAALVNGYEREMTEEQRKQKVRGVYRELEECNTLYDVGIRRGIRTALGIFGITIEGVNA